MRWHVIQLEPWHTSPSQRWVPRLGMYSLSSCTVISVVNLKSVISPQKGTPYTKSHTQNMPMTNKRCFRVDAERKLLVEYHVDSSSIDFYFWQSIPQHCGDSSNILILDQSKH